MALVEIGTSGPQPVKRRTGGRAITVVERLEGADFVVRKKVALDGAIEDVQLTFDDINRGLVELIDAFLDGRRTQVDFITGDFGLGTSRQERYRERAADAEVVAISAALSATSCSFRVTIRVRDLRLMRLAQTVQPPAPKASYCTNSGMRVLLDGAVVSVVAVDSLDFGLRNSGDGTQRQDFREFHIVAGVRASNCFCEDSLAQWYTRVSSGPLSQMQQHRTLSLQFPPSSSQQASPLQLDARGVGMVALRRSIDRDSVGRDVFEFYAEEWDRKGRVPQSPSPSSGNSGGGSGSPPPDLVSDGGAASASGTTATESPGLGGSFSVRLPTARLSGAGALCPVLGDMSLVIIQLRSPAGIGMITWHGRALRVGTFPVGGEGDSTLQVAFTRSGDIPNSYMAKSGTLTMTKVGEKSSGTLRVVTDVVDGVNEPKEATVAGSFTDLPKTC